MPLDPTTAATAPLFPAVGEAGFNDKAYAWAQYFQNAFGSAGALFSDQLTIPASVTFDATASGLSTSFTENLSGAPRIVRLDSTRLVAVFCLTGGLYACVLDESAGTVGTPVLINASQYAVISAILSATNQVLVVANVPTTTAMLGVTLTVSGSTITVNTGGAATAVLAGAIQGQNMGDLMATSTGWVIGYTRDTTTAGVRGVTVSGTTVNIGAETVLAGTVFGGYNLSSTNNVIICYSSGGTQVTLTPITVSGITLTPTTATTQTQGIAVTTPLVQRFANGNYAVSALGGATVNVYSYTGTTIAVVGAGGGAPLGVGSASGLAVFTNQAILFGAQSANVVSSTGTAGTATRWPDLLVGVPFAIGADGVWLIRQQQTATNDTNPIAFKIGISGNNPIVAKRRHVRGASPAGQSGPITNASTMFNFGVNQYTGLYGRGLSFHAAQIDTSNIDFSAISSGETLALVADEPAFRRIHPAHQWSTQSANFTGVVLNNVARTDMNSVWSFNILDGSRVNIRKVVFQ